MSQKSAWNRPKKRSIAVHLHHHLLLKLRNHAENGAFPFTFGSSDIRVYADACDGKVYHYRDKNGLEADMIIQLADGRWTPVEVKMGSKQIDEAAAHLRKLREKVNTDKMGEPSLLMVLTAGEFAYRRDDGVVVIPLGCLKD